MIFFQKLHEDAKISIAYGSEGIDVHALDDFTLWAGADMLVSTGFAVQPPDLGPGMACAVQVWAKSGLSAKKRIETGAGLIDHNYRGEIKVHLYNNSLHPVRFKKGEAFAQLLLVPVILPLEHGIKIVGQDMALRQTTRGESGFGSSVNSDGRWTSQDGQEGGSNG